MSDIEEEDEYPQRKVHRPDPRSETVEEKEEDSGKNSNSKLFIHFTRFPCYEQVKSAIGTFCCISGTLEKKLSTDTFTCPLKNYRTRSRPHTKCRTRK